MSLRDEKGLIKVLIELLLTPRLVQLPTHGNRIDCLTPPRLTRRYAHKGFLVLLSTVFKTKSHQRIFKHPIKTFPSVVFYLMLNCIGSHSLSDTIVQSFDIQLATILWLVINRGQFASQLWWRMAVLCDERWHRNVTTCSKTASLRWSIATSCVYCN